jgi:RNA polymerase sigma factor (sigma-70 family)
MAAAESLTRLVHHLRRRCGAGPTDGDLLDRFARHRDEAAFAELVGRHGRLVLGVARRHLPDRQAAEDVVQCTFAALARRASRIGRPASLVNWLYTVALRQARTGRIRFARRRALLGRLPVPPSTPDPLAEVSGRELVTIIDLELTRLPGRYRLPLLLCALEGLSRDEAAMRLGWTLGTFRGRLERGRELLRHRLTARGLRVPAVVAGGLLATSAEAMPAALVQAVTRAAIAVPPAAMPVKLLVFVAIVLTALGVGTGVALMPGGQAEPKAPAAAVIGPNVDRLGDPLPDGVVARMGTARLRHVAKHGNGLGALFSPDSRSVVTWIEDQLRLWDVETGKLRWQFGTEWMIQNVCFAPDGRALAVISGAGLLMVDAVTGKLQRCLGPNVRARAALAISPDARLLAAPPNPPQPPAGQTAVAPESLVFWDMATGTTVGALPTPGMTPYHLVFSSDGRTLTGYGRPSEQKRLRLKIVTWDVPSRTVRHTAEFDYSNNASRLSDDGRFVVAHGSPVGPQASEIRFWDAASGADLGPLPEPGGRIQAFSGKTLAVLHFGKDDQANELVVWDMASRKPLRRYPLPKWAGEWIEFAPDGRTFLTVIHSQMILLWDAVTGQRRLDVPGHDGRLTHLAFTADGRSLVTGGAHSARVWDAATGEPRYGLPMPDETHWSAPAVSSDGREALVGANGRLRRFDVMTGAERASLTFPRPVDSRPEDKVFVQYPRYSADGRSAAATIGVSYMIGPGISHLPVREPWHVWDLATGRMAAGGTLPQDVRVVDFSPDGARLLAYAMVSLDKPDVPMGPGGIDSFPPGPQATILYLFDTATGKRLCTLRQPDSYGGHCAFSHDGQTLVTITRRHRQEGVGQVVDAVAARGWELRTCRERFRIDLRPISLGYFDPTAVAFAPGDRMLCIAREDGGLQFFDTVTGGELSERPGLDPPATHLAFRPDGQRLATGLQDGTALVWDIAAIHPSIRAPGRLDTAALEERWADLAGEDSHKAHNAIWDLIAAPQQAVELFAARLRPTTAVPVERLRKLMADLDHGQFSVRQAAERGLAQEIDQAEPVLREALKGNLTAEQRRSIEALLDAPPPPLSAETVRALRSVEVLERIGSPASRELLKTLAAGVPGATLTRAATDALKRSP